MYLLLSSCPNFFEENQKSKIPYNHTGLRGRFSKIQNRSKYRTPGIRSTKVSIISKTLATLSCICMHYILEVVLLELRSSPKKLLSQCHTRSIN